MEKYEMMVYRASGSAETYYVTKQQFFNVMSEVVPNTFFETLEFNDYILYFDENAINKKLKLNRFITEVIQQPLLGDVVQLSKHKLDN